MARSGEPRRCSRAIVMDVMMPGLDGVAACRRLGDDGAWSPLLMLTTRMRGVPPGQRNGNLTVCSHHAFSLGDMSPDVRLAESANAFAQHHDGWEDAARAYAQLSEPLFIAGVVLLALTGLVLHRRKLVAASALAVIAAGIGVSVAAVIGRAVDRPRPFVSHPEIQAFLAHAPDPGFPSDHATAAFAIAAVLLLRLGRWTSPI